MRRIKLPASDGLIFKKPHRRLSFLISNRDGDVLPFEEFIVRSTADETTPPPLDILNCRTNASSQQNWGHPRGFRIGEGALPGPVGTSPPSQWCARTRSRI